MLPKSQSIAGSLVVLASGSRAYLNCSGTLSQFILLENSHFRERVQLVPKKPWLIKNQPNIPGGKGLLILGA